ncbi:MAG TPA: L-histidine N(alpha)-methyltransferase [Chthonomonadaceae bacterium]|nr:L-histidine N(alpha)-methyltransferase [Chthonomonadaceae bacterium]
MTQPFHSRLEYSQVLSTQQSLPFCAVVAEGLSAPRKRLPCRFFYDRAGSELFERITRLPEYYLTRTEQAILERFAPEMIAAAGENIALVEFGSGSSGKTRLLLEAALAQQERVHYLPIDISGDFLYASSLELLAEYDRLTITALAAEYLDGIAALPRLDVPRLILFLGSSIGNFTTDEAVAFLTHVRSQMAPQDRLLIGVDLLKERSIIEAAYNDAEGVTAAFNKNLLVRINHELGGRFDLDAFDHYAPFVEAESRIEMHLVSRKPQVAPIAALEHSFSFQEGETIHTENSHKYSLSGFVALCRRAGLTLQARWHDDREWFGLLLFQPTTA